MLGSLGQSALSGLGWLGNILDTPGSVVRGLATGQPDKALAGIFDWDQRVRGGDITGNKDADLFSWEGAGNIATELLMDPLLYASFGASALTKLGKVASKAGVVPKTGALRTLGFAKGSDDLKKLAEVASTQKQYAGRTADDLAEEFAGKSLGGNVGFGLPFGLSEKATFDAMPALNKLGGAIGNVPLAGPLLQKAGAKAAPLGRAFGALFQGKNKGALSEGGQRTAQAQKAGEAAARETAFGQQMGLMRTLPEDMQQAIGRGEFSQEAATQLDDALELYKDKPLPPELAQFEPFRQAHRSVMDEALSAEQGLGLKTERLSDPVLDYLRRRRNPEIGKAKFGKEAIAPELQALREKSFFGVGKTALNKLFARPLEEAVTAADGTIEKVARTELEWASEIRESTLPKWTEKGGEKRWLDLLKARKDPDAFTEAMGKELGELDALKVQSEHLANYKLSLGQKEGYYPYHPLEDIFDKLTGHNLKVLNAKELHTGVASVAVRGAAAAGEGAVPLTKALQNAGLTLDIGVPKPSPLAGTPMPTKPADLFADNLADLHSRGAMQQTLDALRKATKNPALTMDDLSDFYVPADFAADVARMIKPMVAPAALKPFLDVWDSITNVTKAGQTVPWPANKMRNQMTAMYQHAVHGMYDPNVAGGAMNPMAFIKPWRDAQAIRAGKAVAGLNQIPDLAKLSPEQALAKFQEEIVALDIPGRAMQQSGDIVGQGADFGRGLREIVPGLKQESLADQFGKLRAPASEWKNVLGMKGVAGNIADTHPLIKAGRGIDTVLDDTNRIAAYLAKRKQGFTPQAARDAVIKAHYDYSALAPFEKGVMRRVVPFYGWARQNTEAMLNEVFARPGGGVATSVKVAAKLRGDKPLPDKLGTGVAIPVPSEQAGTERYISSFGLPVEEAFTPFTNPLQGTLGQLNPLIKYPLEQLTGRQFFSGRNLEDLYSRTGTAQPIENLLMNSPIGRVISSAGTALDDRKGVFAKALNLGTGARITDVDTERESNRIARDVLQDQLRGSGARVSESMFVPQESLPNLSQADLAKYRLYLQLRQRARQAAQARQQAGR